MPADQAVETEMPSDPDQICVCLGLGDLWLEVPKRLATEPGFGCADVQRLPQWTQHFVDQ